MNKKRLSVLAAALSLSALFAFSACAGEAGRDGKDFELYSVYRELVEEGEFSGTYSEFVKEYLSVSVTEDTSSLSTAINSTLTNVVSVRVSCEYRSGLTNQEMIASGSGVIYSISDEGDDAYIVTNYHVVYDDFGSIVTDDNGYRWTRVSDKLTYTVYLYGMEYAGASALEGYPDYGIPVSVVGYSMENDVAVLKITDSDVLKKSKATAVTLGDSDRTYIGDEVFVIGNPLGEGLAATSGIISSDSETIDMTAADGSTSISPRAIRVSAIINQGNSGGGLFNKKGELLGIVFAKNVEDYVEGMGYALPISNVSGLADSIIERCDGRTVNTKKARMGVYTYVSYAEQRFITEDNRLTEWQEISVQKTEFGCVASGALKSGDVIKKVSLGDETLEVCREWQVSDFLWKVREGDTLTVTVRRGDEETTVKLTFRASDFVAVS